MYFEWKDLTINESFEYACKTWGDREALVHGDFRITYRQLQREIFELTHALKSHGVTKGTRVAYLLSDVPEWVYLFYAISRIGAIAVPLNLTWVGREIEQGLILTDADILVIIDEFRGKDFIDILEKKFPELKNAKKKRTET